MTTAIVATVLSMLSKPSCSLDVFNSCVVDRIDSKSSVDSTSSGVDDAILSTDTSHPIRHEPLLVESNPPRPITTVRMRENLAAERAGPDLPEKARTRMRCMEDHTKTIPASALRTRIGCVEDRCNLYRRELRKVMCETARDKSEPLKAHKSGVGGEVEVPDIPSGLDVPKNSKTKQRQRRMTTSVGSASEPLTVASSKSRSRQRRALDLGISGTPKFRFDHDNDSARRPKLVRLQNRWRRVGGR